MKYIISLLIICAVSFFPQSKDPDKILDAVINEFNKIEDYSVDVNIKIDVDFLKVPDTKAKIYYKKPDKIEVKSEQFALIPKEGLDFSPPGLLADDYKAFYEKEEEIDGHETAVIKVIPLNDKGNVVLTTLWIDREDNVIRKVETTTKTQGTFGMEMKYDLIDKNYHLPDSLIFSFNVDKMNIPRTISGDLDAPEKKDEKENAKKSITGKVIIDYENYKVNKGIPDEIFEKEK